MARPLVKTHIRGFDEDVLRGGIPQGHVVLVRGASGTMKSSLAYYVLYHNALAGSPGLYVTLEQTAAGLLEHVAGLGLKATSVSEALPILDLSRGREYLEEMVSKVGSMAENAPPRGEALLAVLKAKIFELRMKRNFRLLTIDSWDALELVLEFDDRRAETFGFFEWLRDLGVTSLLISEEPSLEAPPTALEEEFLADGIIHLRLEPVTETAFQRRVQCVKMRSVNQDSDDHTLLFENGRFEVARALGSSSGRPRGRPCPGSDTSCGPCMRPAPSSGVCSSRMPGEPSFPTSRMRTRGRPGIDPRRNCAKRVRPGGGGVPPTR